MTGMHVRPAHDDRWLELVSAHADDELTADESARVAAHLAACPSCAALEARFVADRRRARLGAPHDHAQLGARILATAPGRTGDAVADRTSATLAWRLAAAAAVVVAVGLTTLFATDRAEPGTAAQLGQRSILLDDDRGPLVAGDVTVPLGTTVRLRNAGDETHRLEVEVDGQTEAAAVVPGAADEVTYGEAGTYTYRCTVHPAVSGTVTVEA